MNRLEQNLFAMETNFEQYIYTPIVQEQQRIDGSDCGV